MKDPLTTDLLVCRHQCSQDGWHWSMCGKPAKFIVKRSKGLDMPRCGIHARRWKRRAGSPHSNVVSVEAL